MAREEGELFQSQSDFKAVRAKTTILKHSG